MLKPAPQLRAEGEQEQVAAEGEAAEDRARGGHDPLGGLRDAGLVTSTRGARGGYELALPPTSIRMGDVLRALEGPMPKGSAQAVLDGTTVVLPLEGLIDIAAEQARLKKELEKIASEMGKIDTKLNNADFMARAPEEIVEEQHERRAEFAERQVKLSEALSRLG